MTNEYHKPFIQSLIIVAIVTVFAMVSSKYVVNYYFLHKFPSAKSVEFSSQKSQEQNKSSVDN